LEFSTLHGTDECKRCNSSLAIQSELPARNSARRFFCASSYRGCRKPPRSFDRNRLPSATGMSPGSGAENERLLVPGCTESPRAAARSALHCRRYGLRRGSRARSRKSSLVGKWRPVTARRSTYRLRLAGVVMEEAQRWLQLPIGPLQHSAMLRHPRSAGCLNISDHDRLGLQQGAPGVRCAVGISGMQDDRVRQRRPRGGDAVEHHDHGSRHRYRRAARRATWAIAEDTFDVGNLKGVGRVYQQTFIDAYAVARPLPSQARDARPAEATAPLPRACAR
jgi:hypothetical protein